MFETLSDRLQSALSDVRSRGKLSEDDVSKAMRQVRLALLEADVNFQVVKGFTARVKERALGAEVLEALNPGQQVVKLVSEELTALMGGAGRDLAFASKPPTVVLMAGLQGSGKTTATAKLARHLREQHGKDVALAACDVYRPAAVDQLHDLLARVERLQDVGAQRAFLHGGRELLDDLEVDVGLEQREPDRAHRLVHVVLGQLAARADVTEGRLEPF